MPADSMVTGRSGGARLLFMSVMVLSLVIMYAPALYLLLASLTPDEQLGLVVPGRYSLTWYAALLDDRRLFGALEESVLVGLATAVLATPIGLCAALAYRAMTRMRGIFLLIVLSAVFVSGTIEGLGVSVILGVGGVRPFLGSVTIRHLPLELPFALTLSVLHP